MKWETARSGRHVIQSGTIDASNRVDIERELREFWDHIALTFRNIQGVSYLRVEVWGDSGRLICFGVAENNAIRVGEITSQVTITRLANEWTEIENAEFSDDAFENKCDLLMHKYVAASCRAAQRSSNSHDVRYFDADSDDELTICAESDEENQKR